MKVVLIFALFVFVLALSAGMSAALGCGISWVLSHFGVNVAWYVCSVAVFIFGFIVRNLRAAHAP